MECHSPITIRRPGSLYLEDDHIKVACGRCPACDLNRINQWKTRAKAEFKYAKNGFFVTLTYDDNNIPFDAETGVSTLVKSDYQLFMKKLRAKLLYDYKHGKNVSVKPPKIRYLLCGEYGSRNSRPHYHAILFDIPAHEKLSTKNYLIEVVKSSWDLGRIHVGSLRIGAIDYVVSYIAGSRFGFDERGRQKPFLEMSRRPGIGAAYIERSYIYHNSHNENRHLTMLKEKMPKYFRNKIFDSATTRKIINDAVEAFEQGKIERDAQYLLQGIDPEAERLARIRNEEKRMRYKKIKKMRK